MSTKMTLERWPRPLEIRDYWNAAAQIEQQLLTLPGVVSVYRAGSVSAPGISDLDRIAVVSSGGPFPLSWESLPERTRYIAMHPPFLVDTQTFSQHKWFAHLEPLERVVGIELAFEEPPEVQMLATLLGLEGLVILRLKLEKQSFAKRIKIRPTLCELHNLRHGLRLAGLKEGDAADAWAVAREIAALRSSWWEIGTVERTRRMVDIVLSAAPAIDQALLAYGRKENETIAGVDKLALASPYLNVSITSVGPTTHRGAGLALPSLLTRFSRRGAEARWRFTRHTLAVPREVCSLIGRASSGEEQLFQQRHVRVMRYGDFLRRTGKGWSSIGLAQAFAKG